MHSIDTVSAGAIFSIRPSHAHPCTIIVTRRYFRTPVIGLETGRDVTAGQRGIKLRRFIKESATHSVSLLP